MSFVKLAGKNGAVAYIDVDKVAALTEHQDKFPDEVAVVTDGGTALIVAGTVEDVLIDVMRERTKRLESLTPVPF